MKCPRCQHENEAGAKFCEECAAPLARACAKCGGHCRRRRSSARSARTRPGYPPRRLAAQRFASPESYTPKHLAEKILTSKAALEGERKQVTVLFADLKGSMELLADRDPEEARKLLDPVLERMMEAVHRYEGTVNQVMGDGIMALFGAPLAHEDHAVRACYAALRMQEAVQRYAEEVRRAHGVAGPDPRRPQLRRGGRARHRQRSAHGLHGRRPDDAPRRAHGAAGRCPGTILLTAETLRLAEGYVAGEAARARCRSRGSATPVEVYELTGAGPARSRLQAARRARAHAASSAATRELEQLRQALGARRRRATARSSPSSGEPGVGKSRLVCEFTHSHRTQGWLIAREPARSPTARPRRYLPGHRPAQGATSRSRTATTRATIREKVTGKLLTLDRALEPLAARAPGAARRARSRTPRGSASTRPSAASARSTRVKRLLLRESQVQPLLVVFEDLHWIDAETQALLDSLVESLPDGPPPAPRQLPARVPARAGAARPTTRQLRLDPLPPESADELLDALLGDGPEPRRRSSGS